MVTYFNFEDEIARINVLITIFELKTVNLF